MGFAGATTPCNSMYTVFKQKNLSITSVLLDILTSRSQCCGMRISPRNIILCAFHESIAYIFGDKEFKIKYTTL